MKKAISFIILPFVALYSTAQTNTFPTSGNVGIGTTNPTHKLMIADGTIRWGTGGNKEFAASGQDIGGLYIEQVGGSLIKDRIRLQSSVNGNFTGYVQFFVDPNKGFYFMSDNPVKNKVGIGTVDPIHQLDVDGRNEEVTLRISSSHTGANAASLILANSSKVAFNDGIQIIHGAGTTKFNDLAGTTQLAMDMSNGKIGIGTNTPSEKLAVNGNVKAKKVIVSQISWPDYVFDSSYSLRSLSEVEAFIAKEKHLPEMPSAKEVEENGISVGDSQALLLKKMEEMTLYVISMNKEIIQLKEDNKQLKKALKKYEK